MKHTTLLAVLELERKLVESRMEAVANHLRLTESVQLLSDRMEVLEQRTEAAESK